MKPARYKAVIFDLDDTLVRSRELKWAHHKAVAKKFYNIDLADEVLHEHYGKPFDVLIGHLYKNSDTVENMRKANRSLEDQFLKELYTDSLPVVNELLSRDLRIGVLSAMNTDVVLYDLQRLGFPIGKFFHVQGASDSKVHKPDPAVFNPTLEKLAQFGVEKSEAVYVGDALSDLQAAHGAHLGFIGITTGLVTREAFEKAGAAIIIDTLSELPKVIG